MNVLDIEVVPFDIEQANIAREAYRQFGKRSGHQAQVSFNDCMNYATAMRSINRCWLGVGVSYTDVPRIDTDASSLSVSESRRVVGDIGRVLSQRFDGNGGQRCLVRCLENNRSGYPVVVRL